MKTFLIGFLGILMLLLVACTEIQQTVPTAQPIYINVTDTPTQKSTGDTFTIASWNMQIFGKTKASNPELMQKYVNLLSKYDLIFVQEIRDESGTAFTQLCSLLPEYTCFAGEREGRTSSKEQYGVIYKKDFVKGFVIEQGAFPGGYTQFERPPLHVVVTDGNYTFTATVIHVKPDDAPDEIHFLDEFKIDSGNEIILGDLNADCDYFQRTDELSAWKWKIGDNEDTTVSPNTDCAYDRIIVNEDMNEEIVAVGIDKSITPDMSDHYLVWAQVRP